MLAALLLREALQRTTMRVRRWAAGVYRILEKIAVPKVTSDGTVFTSSRREARRQRSSRHRVIVLPRRPGRNHLCPCGSGHKYKRCCAA